MIDHETAVDVFSKIRKNIEEVQSYSVLEKHAKGCYATGKKTPIAT